jgi:hypothetical protein
MVEWVIRQEGTEITVILEMEKYTAELNSSESQARVSMDLYRARNLCS